MKKIILASTSPRRKMMLENAGISFEILAPDFEEKIDNNEFSYDLIKKNSESKLNSIKNKIIENCFVITCDTVVVFENKILGKPKNNSEAKKMLTKLSGNKHFVVSALCLYDSETKKLNTKTQTSEVYFNKITETEIETYINEFNPLDKAGAYGIQELPKGFLNHIDGDYNNIVGLPLDLLCSMIKVPS